MIVLTYAFGQFTGCLIVNDWARALNCINSFDKLDNMSWLRVQYVPVF